MGYLTTYQTHHRWQFFFFQEDSAQVHCVCNTIQLSEMWFSCFRVLPGSVEAQVIWGGIVKRLFIACFIRNMSAKKYQNPFMCVKFTASQMWDVFETRCISTGLSDMDNGCKLTQRYWHCVLESKQSMASCMTQLPRSCDPVHQMSTRLM